MKKKLAPFLSGLGSGLCLAVLIMTLWGMIWPNTQALEGTDLDLAQVQASMETNPRPEFQAESLPDSVPDPASDVNTGITPSLQEGKVIEIKSGMSAKQISDLLAQEGIIDNAQEFHNFSIDHGKARKFMVGKFALSVGMSYEELLELLTIPS
ncbi:MAG: hypothetical protein FWG14_01490 [Peptococcaceae bacterium]|nr:hypothetical protein [Peptococcaceae bacterium]